LLRQLLRGELAQLVVDQRQELLGGGRIALLDGGQDAGDLTHDEQSYRGSGVQTIRQAPNPAASRVEQPHANPAPGRSRTCSESRALRAPVCSTSARPKGAMRLLLPGWSLTETVNLPLGRLARGVVSASSLTPSRVSLNRGSTASA